MSSKDLLQVLRTKKPQTRQTTGTLKIYDENAVPSSKPIASKKPITNPSRVALKDLSNVTENKPQITKKKSTVTNSTNAVKPSAAFKTTTSFVLMPQNKRIPLVSKSNDWRSNQTTSTEALVPVNEHKQPLSKIMRDFDDEIIPSDELDPMDVEFRDGILGNGNELSEGEIILNENIDLDDDTKLEEIVDLADDEIPDLDIRLIEDIDDGDHEDPQFCTEYVGHIMEYLRQREITDQPSPHYLEKQTEISEKHRTILVDWMVEVSGKFQFMAETIFLSVSLLDRFLQRKAVSKSKLQLVGVTSMLIAAKFEEIYSPEINDYVFISANAYTREEILKMERLMLVTLDFDVNVPIHLHFLRRYSKAAHSDSKIHTLSKYLVELSLLDYKLLKHMPSKIAAAAVYISRRMCGISPFWDKTLEHYTQYKESDVVPCARDLNAILLDQASSKYKATTRKYQSSKFLSVGEIPPVTDL